MDLKRPPKFWEAFFIGGVSVGRRGQGQGGGRLSN